MFIVATFNLGSTETPLKCRLPSRVLLGDGNGTRTAGKRPRHVGYGLETWCRRGQGLGTCRKRFRQVSGGEFRRRCCNFCQKRGRWKPKAQIDRKERRDTLV
ncbi:hypothetical protein Hanom_Chr05g00395561 [Helianthus anomalus]